MNNQLSARFAALAIMSGALVLSGCTQVRGHQGYVVDPVLVQSVSPGVDNKASVEASLGRPTFAGQFSDNNWYYVSRNTKQFAFNTPSPTEQMVMRITFDAAGNVTAVDRSGVELVANINPNGDKTPTLGRERSFFQELFGNIGTVGAPGAGAPSGGGDPTRP